MYIIIVLQLDALQLDAGGLFVDHYDSRCNDKDIIFLTNIGYILRMSNPFDTDH